MATNIMHMIFFACILVFIMSADGRTLQSNYTSEKDNNNKVRAVSHATSNSYTGQTNYNDVLGLLTLSLTYPWLFEENEDPCLLPKWQWIECNSDVKPRVIALNLNSKILAGTLPDFSSMDALQKIDLSFNMLSGPIPSFLGTFSDLQELNLIFNHFTGLVPDSLACNKNLKLSLRGNTDLSTSSVCPRSVTDFAPPPPGSYRNTYRSGSSYGETSSTKKINTLALILIVVILVSLVFRIFVGIYAYFRHKSRVAAAVAEASKPTGKDIPTDEMHINARNNDTSP